MKNNIFKIGIIGLLSTSVYAGEVQIGTGTFNIKGGFIGLEQSINTDIKTYSLVEQHAPLFGSKSWFYKYNLTWYDSKDAVDAQNNINATASNISGFNANTPLITPSVDYRLQGLDVNLVLGKDVYHKSENDYVGAGLMVGISIPWIDSKKDSDNDDSTSSSNNPDMNSMPDSETEIYTYKIGPSITGRKSLNSLFSIYGSATYAYQTGTFKNTEVDSDFTVNGTFQEYDFGIRFQPVSYDKKIGFLTFSPRFYATLGYRYTSWDLDDINIDITGTNTSFTQTDFNMNSSITYFGLGYSF